MTRVAAIAAVALVVALAAGCSRDADALEQGSVEHKVARAVADVVSPPIAEVRCPSKIPLGTGVEVTCKVVLADPSGTLPVKVVQRDAVGNLDVVPQRAVLSARQVADSLRVSLRKRFGRSFEVDCGKEAAKVREPGQQLLCRANDKTSQRSVVVTITDQRGSLSFEVVDP